MTGTPFWPADVSGLLLGRRSAPSAVVEVGWEGVWLSLDISGQFSNFIGEYNSSLTAYNTTRTRSLRSYRKLCYLDEVHSSDIYVGKRRTDRDRNSVDGENQCHKPMLARSSWQQGRKLLIRDAGFPRPPDL